MKKINLLFVVCLSILAFSCKKEMKNEAVENTIFFDTISVNEKYHYRNDSTKSFCLLKIKFVHLLNDSTKINDSILNKVQKVIMDMYFEDDLYAGLNPKEAVEEYVNNYMSVYESTIDSNKSHLADSGDDDPYYTTTEDLSGNVLYNSDNFLSFQVVRKNTKMNDIVFTQYSNVVMDLKTGDVLHEEDIFTEDYERALHKLFIFHLLKMNNAKDISEIDNDNVGYNNLIEMIPNRNFYIDNKGITYIFNSGEYSSPQKEAIIITLPYKEIEPYVVEDSPIRMMF